MIHCGFVFDVKSTLHQNNSRNYKLMTRPLLLTIYYCGCALIREKEHVPSE